MNEKETTLENLARTRWHVAMAVSAFMIIVYFGFILLIAFRKEAMGTLLHPGLSLGIVLGALVILLTWTLTWGYVRWANHYVDAVVARLNGDKE